MPKRRLEDLSWDECFMLLGQETVGRFVYNDDLGPAAVPVNYARTAAHEIVFRSDDGSKIRSLQHPGVAFEVDHIDADSRAGWSVLIRGSSQEVAIEHVPELLRRIEGSVPQPWKKGIHKTWVLITPKIVTGRRLAGYAFDDFF